MTRVLTVTRDIDGTVVTYDVTVSRRGLVDTMRAEQMKPGRLVSADLDDQEDRNG